MKDDQNGSENDIYSLSATYFLIEMNNPVLIEQKNEEQYEPYVIAPEDLIAKDD